jgi:hypothetical protein
VAKFRFALWLWDWLFALHEFIFEGDAGNEAKSVQKHRVTSREAEEVFIERQFIPLGEQVAPPSSEPRYGILGVTSEGRALFLAFTLRGRRIRVISARPMNEREKKLYASLRQE